MDARTGTIRLLAGVAATALMSGMAIAQTQPAGTDPAAAQSATGSTTAPQTGGGVEEIVVTAQRRAENLQKTPIAMTAITANALRVQGITNLTGVVQATPSLYFAPYPSSSTTLVLFMRGQGIGDPGIITKDGGVGLYVDGIYQSRPQASTFDLADVERVEVLRGPQGQLYGRNTTGGAVNILSKKPTGEFGVRGELSGGNYDYRRALVTVDLPAVGNLKAKITGLYSDMDGWARNARDTTGVPDANDFSADKKRAVRGAIRWEPSSDITVDYSGDYSKLRSTPVRYVNKSPFAPFLFPGYTADPDRAYRAVYLPYGTTESDGHTLIAEYRPSSSLTLRSLTAVRNVDFQTYQDYTEAFLTPFYTFDHIKSKTWTQEFQAIGNVGRQIKYVLGLYYFDENASHLLQIDAGTGTPGQQFQTDRFVTARSLSKAAYGQVTWTPAFTDGKIDITAGGRYTIDNRDASRNKQTQLFIGDVSPLANRRFNGAGVTIPVGSLIGDTQVNNKKFNPALTITYKPTSNITGYAKVVTGYKAGGTHEGSPTLRTFGPEKVTSYEIGLKTDLFDRRLRFNIDGFIGRYKDLQVDLQADPIDPSLIETLNVGRATLRGIETDVTLVPLRGVTLNASYTFTDYSISGVRAPAGSIFDPAFNAAATTPVGSDISRYFVLPWTPRNAVRLSGDWQIGRVGPGMVAAHVDYTWKDKVFTTSGDGPAVPTGRDFPVNQSYGLVDGRVSYSIERSNGQHVSLAFWGKNIFDKRYPGFNTGFGSIITGYTAQALSYGTPATYGVDLGFSF